MIRPALLTLAALASAAVTATTFSGTEEEVARPRSAVQPIRVGDIVPAEMILSIERPGLYGVGDPAPGMAYAVVGSSLVRLDPASNLILAIIRPVLPPR